MIVETMASKGFAHMAKLTAAYSCVYTDRVIAGRSVRWIISLRKANKREIRKYDEAIKIKIGEQNKS